MAPWGATECFLKLYAKGQIKKEKSVVNFDLNLKTTISDLEVDYKENKSFLYFIDSKQQK